MAASMSIAQVFKYTTPISLEQISQRVFVDRADYKDRILDAIFQDDILVISGYSSIGKTTLINIATAKKQLSAINSPFTAVVSVVVDHTSEKSILQDVYDSISVYTSGKKLDSITPSSLAGIIHTNRLLLILDGVNSLYEDTNGSKDLFNFCKAWTDIPRGTKTQSKVVLIASGISEQISLWLSQAGAGKRLPRTQIHIPPWSESDLKEIITAGSQQLNAFYDADLLSWMINVSCGLPATMTLIASLATRRANNERDAMVSDSVLEVKLTDLYGIFGENSKFREILFYEQSIEALNVPALFVLYILGMNGGNLTVQELDGQLRICGFPDEFVGSEIESLVYIENKEELTSWSLKELSFGTFAFLRLYYRSKLNVQDAEKIVKAIDLLNRANHFTDQCSTFNNNPIANSLKEASVVSILFLAADPSDASRLRLGEEFREIQEKLKLARLRHRFKLEIPQLSLRPTDIAQALLDTQPNIVHFSGHGTSSGALCFENQTGQIHLVQSEALAALFAQFRVHVHCVVLNACYSEAQATAVARHIPHVIGMGQAIGDKAAIAFSIGFYQAIGAGRSIEEAYELGCVQIRMHGISEHLTPKLIKGQSL